MEGDTRQDRSGETEVEEEIHELGSDYNRQMLIGDKNYLNTSKAFDLEYGTRHINTRQHADWGTIMKLAFQCIGVVYGDLGTSPLYVLSGIFPNGIKHSDDLVGALSLIIYSIVIITLIKYVFIVLSANDNGDGGTFALYSLICRHAKINLIPNLQIEDTEVSNYKLKLPNRRNKRASAVKSVLENSRSMKYFLLLITMLGVSMVLGDGILTPCISVLSAVSGIKEATTSLDETKIMWMSVVILILLFQIQRFGTDKVGYTFAPILMLWFAFIAAIGIYNFVKYDPTIIKAVNPWCIVQYFKRNKKDAWISLGGVLLCLTGSEALFADLGHFNIRSIQLSSCVVLVPSVLLAYLGQCSYLKKYPENVGDAFFKSTPKSLYWPQFIIAVLASIIASQSLISASFSIVQQSVALGCFPRVKVVHTSAKYEGQVYVPEINTLLMLACVAVTLGFKNTLKIGNAYGIAVTFVFVITSAFLVLVMIMIWRTNIFLVVLYILTIGAIELLFLSSVLYKFVEGGYLPLFLALVVMLIMFVWNYGYRKKYLYELENKVPTGELATLLSNPRVHRVRSLGLFYTQLVQGISPVFTRYVSTVSSLHSVLVFVSIKSLPISKVPPDERFLFQRLLPQEMVFRCVARFGYKDLIILDHKSFETNLVNQLMQFIEDDCDSDNDLDLDKQEVQNELAFVNESLTEGGVVCLMGQGEMLAKEGSNAAKRVIVDYLYNWLNRCVREPDEVFMIPRKNLLKVGMTYHV